MVPWEVSARVTDDTHIVVYIAGNPSATRKITPAALRIQLRDNDVALSRLAIIGKDGWLNEAHVIMITQAEGTPAGAPVVVQPGTYGVVIEEIFIGDFLENGTIIRTYKIGYYNADKEWKDDLVGFIAGHAQVSEFIKLIDDDRTDLHAYLTNRITRFGVFGDITALRGDEPSSISALNFTRINPQANNGNLLNNTRSAQEPSNPGFWHKDIKAMLADNVGDYAEATGGIRRIAGIVEPGSFKPGESIVIWELIDPASNSEHTGYDAVLNPNEQHHIWLTGVERFRFLEYDDSGDFVRGNRAGWYSGGGNRATINNWQDDPLDPDGEMYAIIYVTNDGERRIVSMTMIWSDEVSFFAD
jgi:hypothetical protein